MITRQIFLTRQSVVAVVLLLLICSGPVQTVTRASAELPSASDHFKITLASQPTVFVDFSARHKLNGTTLGEMSFKYAEGNPPNYSGS